MSQLTLFDDENQWPVPPLLQNSVFIGTLPKPIWTETKDRLLRTLADTARLQALHAR